MGMGHRFTMYWSSLETYEECPQRFLWRKGWNDLDVGGGPGRKKPPPEQKSEHHAIMGKTIAEVSEEFYNQEWWKEPEGLLKRLEESTRKHFDYFCDKPNTYVPFGGFSPFGKVPTRAEMLNICHDGIRGFMRTMKHNKLIGPYARAEVDLVGYINNWHPIGGRADLIVRRDDTGVMILDGKNSMTKDKYTNPDQLRWYALCMYVVHGRLPDRLGFIYYRYPYDAETGESGVSWVDFTKEDIKGLAQRAVTARRAMDAEKFDPTPSPTACKFCIYESVCDARQNQKASRRRKRKPTELDKAIGTQSGLVELDIGD
jgi:hypothetical protein